MNEIGNAKREETQFESFLKRFEETVTDAELLSGTYATLTGKLIEIRLKCEEQTDPKGNSPIVEPNTMMYKLSYILLRLQDVNVKNREIIDNLKQVL